MHRTRELAAAKRCRAPPIVGRRTRRKQYCSRHRGRRGSDRCSSWPWGHSTRSSTWCCTCYAARGSSSSARSVCPGASDRHLARRLPGARDRVPEGAVGGRGRPAPSGPAECKIVELTMKNEISRAASGGRVHRVAREATEVSTEKGIPIASLRRANGVARFATLSPPKSVRPPRSPARLENDDLRRGARPTRPNAIGGCPHFNQRPPQNTRAFIMSTSSQLGRTRCHA